MIELVIPQRRRDLGSFEVGHVLPFAKRRRVGPYIFFDRIGPKDLAPGLPREADVRPHPHIGIAGRLVTIRPSTTARCGGRGGHGPTFCIGQRAQHRAARSCLLLNHVPIASELLRIEL